MFGKEKVGHVTHAIGSAVSVEPMRWEAVDPLT